MSDLAVVTEPGIRITASPARLYLANLNTYQSRRTMEGCLEALVRIFSDGQPVVYTIDDFPWADLGYQETTAVRARLIELGLSPSTVNKYLSALRGVLKQVTLLNPKSPQVAVISAAREVKSLPVKKLPVGRYVPVEEMALLLGSFLAEKRRKAVRDLALVSLLYATGARAAEGAGIELDDYDPATGHLLINGKGGKEREVRLHPTAMEYVGTWLELRGDMPGALFPQVTYHGAVELSRGRALAFTGQTTWDIVSKRSRRLGIYMTPHDIRRTRISDLFFQGVDPALIMKIVGHDDFKTLMGYDMRPFEAAAEAMAQQIWVTPILPIAA
ncbi:tyrosine-type recombinase/integrase [Herbidospora galbida]|nr:site-specific integrase [Herbidospora galbida]